MTRAPLFDPRIAPESSAGERDAPATVLILPCPPSANRLWRNNRLSPEYRAWKQHAGWEARAQLIGIPTINGAFTVRIEAPKMRRDLDNSLKPLLDLCQAMGAIRDDKNAVEIHMHINPDRETFRVELEGVA